MKNFGINGSGEKKLYAYSKMLTFYTKKAPFPAGEEAFRFTIDKFTKRR